MIKAYMDRKRIFLLDHRWMTLPWIETGKDNRQQVSDGGLELGALLEDFDNITRDGNTTNTISTLIDILHRGLECLGTLKAIKLEHGNLEVMPLDFTFRNAQSATATLHCWALFLGYRQLFDPLTKRLLSDETVDLPIHVTQDIQLALDQLSDQMCLDVCRRIMAASQVILRNDDMAYIGTRRLPFPLLSAVYHLKSVDAPELAAAVDLYTRFKNDKGVGIASQLHKGVSSRFDALNPRGPTGYAQGQQC